ncbi:1-phosphofructokinase [Alkaliphilus metalliredigens QYMF]|uniref:Tagatose-6-phosphate kinase n=1 Tax=Alkaliphilus metalliredigens (strain QYMF) TaxID=293826 RepID=A6TLI3_ALKMQ|nr:1-phosphofructokinase [Alkaliphilus metalliredigens]ABR47051.1 1-phosphofructokinase [Alkaliphilus metalliredigens QYMF]
MIITVTMNPAIDRTIEIADFTVGKVNRIETSKIDVGGKGINVSKVIQELGGHSMATGFVGGATGEEIKKHLKDKGIQFKFIDVAEETRTNIKMVDSLKGIQTDFNESGAPVAEKNIVALKKCIEELCNPGDLVIIAGSTPCNVNHDIYLELTQLIKNKGGKVLLDADANYLMEGIKATPFLIKPNLEELQRAIGTTLEGVEAIAKAGKDIVKRGITHVVISMGEEGALFIREEGTIWAQGIQVPVGSTVGAGDAMVAAMAYGLEQEYDYEKLVRLSMAAGTAAVMTKGTESAAREKIIEIEKQVQLISL